MIYVARISNEFEAASCEDDILTAPLLLLCRFFFNVCSRHFAFYAFFFLSFSIRHYDF